MFSNPNLIDIHATVAVPTPKSWQGQISAAEVQVLPLRDQTRTGVPGWCTVGVGLEESPDVEVMCGGINSKQPQHAALWRQGHLLHFGFEESPALLNAPGRALLENSICYAARFTEDRPIVVTQSSFTNKTYPRSQRALRLALDQPTATAKSLAVSFGGPIRSTLEAMSSEPARQWIRENLGFLVADERGMLVVDEDLKRLGVALDAPEFPARALASATAGSEPALALLARRVPEGPGASAALAVWRDFLAAKGAFLFFSETAGFVWRLDPLAAKRGIPSAELRGSRRASPTLEPTTRPSREQALRPRSGQ